MLQNGLDHHGKSRVGVLLDVLFEFLEDFGVDFVLDGPVGGEDEIFLEGMFPVPKMRIVEIIVEVGLFGSLEDSFFRVFCFLFVPHFWFDVVLVVVLVFSERSGHGVGSESTYLKQGVFEFLADTVCLGVVMVGIDFRMVV